MKKYIVFILSIMCFWQCACAKAQVYTVEHENAVASGVTQTNLLGANGELAKKLNGTIEWNLGDGKSKVYRAWCYMTISPDASEDVSFSVNSEHTKKTYPLDFSKGNSGWREIGIVNCGGAGITVSIKSNNQKPALVSAIRLEELNSEYTALMNFSKNNENTAVFVKYVKTAYKNGVRVFLDKVPVFSEGEVYISLSDVKKFINSPVKLDAESLSFTYNGSAIKASTQNDMIKNFNGVFMVNITKLLEMTSMNSLNFNDSLAMFSADNLSYDTTTNARELKSIISAMRLY